MGAWRWLPLLILGMVSTVAVLLLALSSGTAPSQKTLLSPRQSEALVARRRVLAGGPTSQDVALAARPTYGMQLAPADQLVHVKLKGTLASGIMFDVASGRLLWADQPGRVLPIASLTKIMTALVVVDHAPPTARAFITFAAVHYTGSGVGHLPVHHNVEVEPLLYGLLLPSGNDAAIALAEHVGHGQPGFVDMMNARARAMGLGCTHFSNVSGIVDQDNYSCTSDLAVMAHALLQQPRLAKIVGSSSAVLPFPTQGGKLYLYNNNPLYYMHYQGTDGVKTGYTHAAGMCLVATARRGRSWLGVVLLNSQDTGMQAQQLLDAGFAQLGRH